MVDEYVVELTPVYMENSRECLGSAVLRKFQRDLVDITDGVVVLTAPTGSGKTVTLLTEHERGIALGLYPNNELVCSQIAGLHRFIVEFLGMKPKITHLLDYCITGDTAGDNLPINIYSSDKPIDMFGRPVAEIYVTGMSGRVIKRLGEAGKLNTLVELSDKYINPASTDKSKYVITLGTPDTFFLIALYIYRNFEDVGKIISWLMSLRNIQDPRAIGKALRKNGFHKDILEDVTKALLPFRKSTIFIDEYHLYGSYEISSLKALAWALKNIHGWENKWEGRIVFSSATPRKTSVHEIAEELGYRGNEVKEINAIDQVKEKGDDAELVRGPIRLVFVGLDTGVGNRVGKLYASSERAYELIGREDFMELVKSSMNKGMVILEKVSHAEIFTREIHSRLGIKPKCLYSMQDRNICDEKSESLIVGTGARIGQGVEYTGVNYGVVARVTAADFLQSISRIGRRCRCESTIFVPIDRRLLEVIRESETWSRGKIRYKELARWTEEHSEPYIHMLPSGYEKIYDQAMEFRVGLLKSIASISFYMLSKTPIKELKELSKLLSFTDRLEILAPPDTLYSIAMFRSTGPQVSYCRERNGELDCSDEKEDLGTIIRNYEVESRNGRLVIKNTGRGEISVVCRKDSVKDIVEIETMNKDGKTEAKTILISWNTLRDLFDCSIVCEKKGVRERLNSVEDEVEDTLFLVIPLKSGDFAEYISRTGRGLPLKTMKTYITLIYV